MPGSYWLLPIVKTTLENHLNISIKVAEQMGKTVNVLEYEVVGSSFDGNHYSHSPEP